MMVDIVEERCPRCPTMHWMRMAPHDEPDLVEVVCPKCKYQFLVRGVKNPNRKENTDV